MRTVASPTFASVYRRQRLVIVGVAVIVMAVALVSSLRQPTRFVSSVEVLVLPGPLSAPGEQPNMVTEKRLVSSSTVAATVIDDLDLVTDPASLIKGLSVDVPADTEILDISYRHPDAARAQQIAQGFAQAYLGFRERELSASEADALSQAREQLREDRGALLSLQSKAGRTTNPGQLAVLTSRAASLANAISALKAQIDAASASTVGAGGEIVQAADLPTAPSGPNLPMDIALGLFVGLGFGFAVGFAREYFDDRIRSRDEVEDLLGSRVLCSIPPLPTVRRGSEDQLITLTDPGSVGSDAFRRLRTDLEYAVVPSGLRSVVVTSCNAEEGKTLTAANLSVVLAKAGKRVVLVSGDLRAPTLEGVFDVRLTPGLADVLAAKSRLADSLLGTSIEGLWILPAGSPSEDPSDLLGSNAMRSLVVELERTCEIAILDAAPLVPVPDGRVLLSSCDAVLLVVDVRSTLRRDLAEARRQLEQVAATVLGVVLLNDRSASTRTYPSRAVPPENDAGDRTGVSPRTTTRDAPVSSDPRRQP